MLSEEKRSGSLREHGRRGLPVAAIAVLVACIGVIVFGSPLFRVLGFEYSSLSAILLSLFVGLLVSRRLQGEKSTARSFRILIPEIFVLFALPLVVSLFSAIFITNCALWDGVVFYLEVALPATIIASTFGAACGMLARKNRSAMLLYLTIWFGTLVLSFLPGYINPQIFTYGWQYGFFPGLVWDDALTLTAGYAAFQVMAFALAIAFLQLVRLSQRPLRRRMPLVLLVASLVVVIAVGFLSDDLRIESSHARVDKILRGKIVVNSHTTVRFLPRDFTQDQQRLIKGNVLWYLHTIRQQLGLKDTSRDLTIYIYPNSDSRYEYIGTRTASIAKPWLGELHITKGSLRTLKHELTHLLMAEVGSFPFDVSWATGLTEGVAMSIELPYDGLRSIDQQAARVIQTRPHSGVQEIMSFSGFASNASFTSYTIAGSFSRYLLETYGAAAYLKVYHSLDFEAYYHRSLAQLEQAWLAKLKLLETPMNMYDSLRTLSGVADTSVLYRPCLRRIGLMLEDAGVSMRRHKFAEADSLYAIVFNESGRSNALLNRVYAQIDLRHPEIALDILHKRAKKYSVNWYVTLNSRAVAEFIAGDTLTAVGDLATLATIGASDASMVDNYIYSKLLATSLSAHSSVDWKDFFYQSYAGMSALSRARYLDNLAFSSKPELAPYLNFLSANAWMNVGNFNEARIRTQRVLESLQTSSMEDSVLLIVAKMQWAALTDGQMPTVSVPIGFDGLSEEIAEFNEKLTYLHSIGYSLVH
jgi:tetratricopeptide (TPR) repeat protein